LYIDGWASRTRSEESHQATCHPTTGSEQMAAAILSRARSDEFPHEYCCSGSNAPSVGKSKLITCVNTRGASRPRAASSVATTIPTSFGNFRPVHLVTALTSMQGCSDDSAFSQGSRLDSRSSLLAVWQSPFRIDQSDQATPQKLSIDHSSRRMPLVRVIERRE
jgi:hypothetical protein